MPGLVLFGRRWAIASDDFVFPSFGETILRLSWLIVLIVFFAAHQNGFNCDNAQNLKSFYIGTIVLNSIGLINIVVILRISMKGTIKDTWPRRFICWPLYAKIFLLLPEAVWVCLSTYWAFGFSYTCLWSVVWTVRGTVICSWVVGCLTFFGILASFDPLGSLAISRRDSVSSENQGADESLTMGSIIAANEVWENRCRVLCCCIACNPDTQNAFTDVGKLVAEFFHELDLVPTDLAAGIMLVYEKQANMDSQLYSVSTSPNPPLGDYSQCQPKSWMTIFNMSHYMKFAMGSYGWPFYLYQNILTGACRLCSSYRCCSCMRKANGIFKDNICQCNTAAIKKLTHLHENDLIYVTFHNQFKQVPFYVALDRPKNTVVISIRGTLSLKDALADLSARGATLDIPGVENSYCHAAMLDCANYIKSKLESLNILEAAFGQLREGAALVLVGHSLGAGVAAILSVLLRPQYPDLICFSFSPPGGLMSASASKYTREFVCSVVVDKDIVPRLGMYTLTDLKVKILQALCETNKPKYRILATGCLRLLCCLTPSGDSRAEERNNVLSRAGARYTEERSLLQGQTLQDALRVAEHQLQEMGKTEWPLHPAGQILHIRETSRKHEYDAVWSRPECFDKIIISKKMVTDHMPNTVSRVLDELADRQYVPLTQLTSAHLQASQEHLLT
ncbi:diacylglycerol lipase-beta-like isoform X2 [Physella acuta]|uniref:diacylglycerol lipase-beta-like isoform X2 n=1 Tax=Physella acuta TaxID=109671 RepID=UPI0027DD023A|nr:diacylglycerol lipase-beta-like isoform X2 [Physella acuta]